MQIRTFLKLGFGAGLAVVLIGCGPDPVASARSAPAGSAPTLEPFVPKAEAGIRREPADPTALIEDAKGREYGVRGNPFALHADEVAFDRSQRVASLVEGQNWYNFIAVEPTETRQETFEVEAQPARRLAGILIGETITALIDMGDGKPLQTIRPGQKLEGTEWVVQSIDEEKAILRREGSNKRPKFVVVRLEDSATMSQGGTPGGGQNDSGRGPGNTQLGRPRDD
jgi:hypothetical protein